MLRSELDRGTMSDGFISLVADRQFSSTLVTILSRGGLVEEAERLNALNLEFFRLAVDDVKADRLELAEQTGSQFISLFSVFGSISIIVGLLLIFLVFVLLAAARSSEIGMARGSRYEARARRPDIHLRGRCLYCGRRSAGNAWGSGSQHHSGGSPPKRCFGRAVYDPQQLHDPLRGHCLLRRYHSHLDHRRRLGVVGEQAQHHRCHSRSPRGDGEASGPCNPHHPAGVAHCVSGRPHNRRRSRHRRRSLSVSGWG